MVCVYVTKWSVALCWIASRNVQDGWLQRWKRVGWTDERRGPESLGTAPNPESD
jgi:hypothetical protein